MDFFVFCTAHGYLSVQESAALFLVSRQWLAWVRADHAYWKALDCESVFPRGLPSESARMFFQRAGLAEHYDRMTCLMRTESLACAPDKRDLRLDLWAFARGRKTFKKFNYNGPFPVHLRGEMPEVHSLRLMVAPETTLGFVLSDIEVDFKPTEEEARRIAQACEGRPLVEWMQAGTAPEAVAALEPAIHNDFAITGKATTEWILSLPPLRCEFLHFMATHLGGGVVLGLEHLHRTWPHLTYIMTRDGSAERTADGWDI